MKLSRFFELAEMTRSDTAQREGIANEPDTAAREELRKLCIDILDPLREALGKPITVNSGYRGPVLNRRIGGASNSQHVEGKAADIQCSGTPVLGLFQQIIRLGLPFDQLIYEARSATARWVHVSHNAGGNRGQIMIAKFDDSGRPIAYPRVTVDEALAMREPAPRTRSLGVRLEYIEMGDEPDAVGRLPDDLAEAAEQGPRRPARTASRGVAPAGRATRKAVRSAIVRGAGGRSLAAKRSAAKRPAAKRAAARRSPAKKRPATRTSGR
jgi:hypothetical protein